ncbi:MAG: DUF4350 domain-containing protein [Promethearchaeota archaeon]
MVKIKGGKSSERSINISKGIIYSFFTIYLIIYGIGITIFIENYDAPLPAYLSYLPLLCFVGAIFTGFALLIFIRNVHMQKSRETKSRKKRTGSIYKQALLLIIFIFSFIPLFAPIIDQGKNDQYNSIYNDEWNGCSDLKNLLEEKGYIVNNIQSSLSTTERINKSVVLLMLGSNQFYNPIYEIPYFMDFLENGNSILLCHDHGSTETLLWEIFFANILNPDVEEQIPVTIFPKGTLRDTGSYKKSPEFPVITTFKDHPIKEGVDQIILSKSSSAGIGPLVEVFGWDAVAYSSANSYVDKNDDKEFDPEDDSIDLSYMLEAIPDYIPENLEEKFENFPLGIFPMPVILAKEAEDARIVVTGDASLFNNELINEDGYDNQKLALNIIEWLTHGEDKENWVIAFDEAHIRPEKSRDMTSAGIFGFYIQYIVHLSTNPITAWIYPLLAIYTLNKYLPKKDKKKEQEKKAKEEEKKEEQARFRTSSFFAKKIEWYREKARYGKALSLLYRRLERKLNAQLGGRKITTQNVINLVIAKDPKTTKFKIRRITRLMDRILIIKRKNRKVRSEREFEQLFFEMEWVVNNV